MSEIEMGGTNRFGQLKVNAYRAYSAMNRRFKLDEEDTTAVAKHLQDCIDNPTRGLLARKHVQSLYGLSLDSFQARMNREEIFSDTAIQRAENKLIAKYKKLYPKTGYARIQLIEGENVVLNRVKPIKSSLKRTLLKYIKF